MPRTRQSERVRRRVESNRSQRADLNEGNRPSTSYGRVNSNRVSSTSATTAKKPRKKSRKSNVRKSKSIRYKTVWVLDEFGEAVPIKRKMASKKRRFKKKLAKPAVRMLQKSVKKRLAAQLGICTPRNSAQSLPDARISGTNVSNIGLRRHQAGIPNLDLFGNFNRLEYFSQSEDEGTFNEGESRGVHTLLGRRASNPTDILRRVVRRKAAVVNIPTVSSSTDILDSIMDSQEKLLSKNSILSVVDSSGKLKIENKKKEPILNNNSPGKPDFNSYVVKETPWHGRNNSGYRQNNRNNWSNNRNWQNNSRYYQGRYGSSSNYGQGPSNSGGNYMPGRDQFYNDIPQDYTQRTLCEAEMLQDEDKDKNDPGSNTAVSDTDVDIYGDIENETVSTSRVDDDFRPPSPPLMQSHTSNTNTDEDNDSESGMVIDTDRGPDDSVSSTVGITSEQVYSPGQPTYSPGQPSYSPGPGYSPGQPTYSPGPPTYSPGQPTYSPGQPTYSPGEPTGSPGEPTGSPGEPTGSPERPRYSPGEPTDSPEEHSIDGAPDSDSLALGYDQLQRDLASGYDALHREIASGFDELQREFASGFKEFQPLVNMTSDQSIIECDRSQSEVEKSSNYSDHEMEVQAEPDSICDNHQSDVPQEIDMGPIEVIGRNLESLEPEMHLDSRPSEPSVPVIRHDLPERPVESNSCAAPAAFSDSCSEVEPETEPEPLAKRDRELIYFSNPPASVTDNFFNSSELPEKVNDDEEVSNDGCPNFSIYSRESKSVALTTDISMPTSKNIEGETEQNTFVSDEVDPITDESDSLPATPQIVTVEKTGSDPRLKKHLTTSWNLGGLYSDSEDESVVKKTSSFVISDIKDMTEDILSEEERSYTPVLDEKGEKSKEGLEGLDTEMISDDDRNDFDESHELKTVSDGDALEINAKESELEFTRPEEFEEGEIVDKNKEKVIETTGGTPEKKNRKEKVKSDKKGDKEGKKRKKEKGKLKESSSIEGGPNKENLDKEPFKKLTKSNKERNYRDKDKNKTKDAGRERSRTKTPEITEKEKEAKKKKEKRKELERYNVRAIIAEKPRPPPKDKFGRDLRQTPSRSRSRSYTPPLVQMSPPKVRQTPSPIRAPSPVIRRKSRSVSRARTPPRVRRSISKRRSTSKTRDRSGKRKASSRSRSGGRKRDRSKTKKRKRSNSRSNRRKKSREKNKKKSRGSQSHRRSRSPHSRSVSPRRNRREWTPSLSRSLTPPHHMSPSWTPPRTDNALRNKNFTVILNNEAAKKKKDKRNRERRRKDDSSAKRRRRERERTPPPSKEVFASGDNILVSVSFNNENETRDISTRDNRKRKEASAVEQQKKNREKRIRNRKDLSRVKPVAIIDLERSPFQEIVGSPKDIIVLSDSDNNETENRNIQNNICDSSQQVASPEETPNFSTGPKTPPEPSVKFALLPKPPQLRAINNPLHDPLETIEEEVQEELNSSSHKGPNTPPEEPPTSPPSSPDAYDPFEPTKSRSPTPDPGVVQGEIGEEQILQEPLDNRASLELEKSGQTPDVIKSLTPPMLDIQPADSQSSVQEIPDPKSPDERTGLPINQLAQPSNAKPVGQTIPFSAGQTTISSTPISTNITISRINILSSSMITPSSTIPQRIVLPNQVKSSPVKILPTKAAIKSTPIKPIQSKISINKKSSKQQNGNSLDDINLDFDSPYSPGSSDYEDLFEPPSEPLTAITKSKASRVKRTSKKNPSTFDALFGSPNYNKKTSKRVSGRKTVGPSKTKHIGVKIDEDSLKILEDLPNSAVEMQVKDKFLKKLNRQERVVEEVKLVLKPYYNKKKITKNEYKDIMRRAVPKICHNKSGEINPIKIRHLIEAYVKKVKHSKKVTSSSSLPQKVV